MESSAHVEDNEQVHVEDGEEVLVVASDTEDEVKEDKRLIDRGKDVHVRNRDHVEYAQVGVTKPYLGASGGVHKSTRASAK